MTKLITAERKHLKSGAFALPRERAYPIPDKAHARNALSRVSQFGTPEAKATCPGCCAAAISIHRAENCAAGELIESR